MGELNRGLRYVSPEYAGDTYPEPQKTPFPGVAPVPTVRIHRDCEYDEGLDMMDENTAYGEGKVAPWVSLNAGGANGKLGLDPGRPKSDKEPAPTMFGLDLSMPPVRRVRRGK